MADRFATFLVLCAKRNGRERLLLAESRRLRGAGYAKILDHRYFIRQQIFQNTYKLLFVKVAGVAQLAEHLICNQEVGGSNPSSGTIIYKERSIRSVMVRIFPSVKPLTYGLEYCMPREH